MGDTLKSKVKHDKEQRVAAYNKYAYIFFDGAIRRHLINTGDIAGFKLDESLNVLEIYEIIKDDIPEVKVVNTSPLIKKFMIDDEVLLDLHDLRLLIIARYKENKDNRIVDFVKSHPYMITLSTLTIVSICAFIFGG